MPGWDVNPGGEGGGSGPALSDATPAENEGAGSPGTSPDAARALHVHPGLEVTDDDTVDVLASEIEFVFGAAGATPTLAEVLAVGNDTGGVEIVNQPSIEDPIDARASLHAIAPAGGYLALATVKADAVDLHADVSATATTTGGGNPKANRTAEATDTAGNAEANTTASARAQADGNTTVHSLNNRAGADVDVQSGGSGDATALRAATANGSGGANVSSTALVFGAGTATNVVTAIAAGGTASIGPVADATTALIMVTGLPTSDPVVAGALWNDSGTLKVSAG